MSLEGKLISEISIKSDGDVFHEIFRHRPHHISSMCDKIQNVDIHEGEWGPVGSVISWYFIHDRKEKVAKDIIEAIDEENKLVKFKVIGGDILKEYKSFSFTVHVETKGENNLVTWIIEYEKKNANVPDPHMYTYVVCLRCLDSSLKILMDVCCRRTNISLGLGMTGISSFGNVGTSGFGRVGSSDFGISGKSGFGKVGISGRCGNLGLGNSGIVTSKRWRAYA